MNQLIPLATGKTPDGGLRIHTAAGIIHIPLADLVAVGFGHTHTSAHREARLTEVQMVLAHMRAHGCPLYKACIALRLNESAMRKWIQAFPDTSAEYAKIQAGLN